MKGPDPRASPSFFSASTDAALSLGCSGAIRSDLLIRLPVGMTVLWQLAQIGSDLIEEDQPLGHVKFDLSNPIP